MATNRKNKFKKQKYTNVSQRKKESNAYSGKLKNNRSLYKKKKVRKRVKQTLPNKSKQLVKQLLISMIIFIILLKLIAVFTFSVIKVDGFDMMPTVNDGEWVFVSKVSKIRRFKLVALKKTDSNEIVIQRIVGLPGESIIYDDDILYVNYQEVDERFLEEQLNRVKDSQTVFTKNLNGKDEIIPKDKYLVLGDNRPYASDSREFGYVDKHQIIGVVEIRVLPIHLLKQF